MAARAEPRPSPTGWEYLTTFIGVDARDDVDDDERRGVLRWSDLESGLNWYGEPAHGGWELVHIESDPDSPGTGVVHFRVVFKRLRRT